MLGARVREGELTRRGEITAVRYVLRAVEFDQRCHSLIPSQKMLFWKINCDFNPPPLIHRHVHWGLLAPTLFSADGQSNSILGPQPQEEGRLV